MAEAVDVMDEEDVYAIETQSLAALFVGAHHGVIRIVVDESHLRRVDEEETVDLVRRTGFEQPADLG